MRESYLIVLATSCAVDPKVLEHKQEVETWRQKRLERLRAPDGWLSLVGLVWLDPGERRVGSDPASDVVLPSSAPTKVGTLRYEPGGPVELVTAPGVTVEVDGARVERATMLGDQTVARLGGVSFQVIERNGRLAVRIKDAGSSVRTDFSGIDSWPVDPTWRIEAQFQPYTPPRKVEVPNVLGWTDLSDAAGIARFVREGVEVRLEALDEGDELFFIFADATNAKESYGAGRFLYAPRPVAGAPVVLDFNRAYNPPCAFTPFATCPLPPKGNRLPFPVRAGEKRWGDAH